MKTRILAFALVCIMVVSMVPVVATAADAKCPGNAVGDPEHSIYNCEYTTVEVVDPNEDKCTNGYTVYKCNGCGTTFAGSLIPVEHNWVAQSPIAATCKDDGYNKVEKCSKCQAIKKSDVVRKETIEHTYVVIDELDNEQLVRQCSVCGDKETEKCNGTGYENGTHTWAGVTPVITVEPTKDAYGTAVYTCTNNKCGYTETVTIHNHLVDDPDTAEVEGHLVKTAKRDATCTVDGYSDDFYTCTVCKKVFKNVAEAKTQTAAPTGWITTADKADTSKVEGILLPKTNHVGGLTSLEQNRKDPVCSNMPEGVGTLTDGSVEKWCEDCDTWVEIELEAAHQWAPTVNTPATCMAPGVETEICSVCLLAKTEIVYWVKDAAHKDSVLTGANKTQNIKNLPTEYSSYAHLLQYSTWEFVSTDSKLPGCYTAGTFNLKCTACASKANTNTQSLTLKALGCDTETIVIPATCSTYGISYDICVRPGCDRKSEDFTTVAADGEHSGEIAITVGEGDSAKTVYVPAMYEAANGVYFAIPYTKNVEESTGNVTWAVTTGTFKYITSSLKVGDAPTGTSLDEANMGNHHMNYDVIEQWSCTQNGSSFDICAFCNATTGAPVAHNTAAAGHDYTGKAYYKLGVDGTWEESTTGMQITCQDAIWVTKTCKNEYCQESGAVALIGTGAKFSTPVVHTAAHAYDAAKVYTKTEAHKYHTFDDSAMGDPYNNLADPCEEVLLYKVTCTACNKSIFVKDDTTGYHVDANGVKIDTTKKTEATCTEPAYYVAWTCARKDCGAKVEEKTVVVEGSEPLNHDFSQKGITGTPNKFVVVAAQAATIKDNGTREIRKCGRKCNGVYCNATVYHIVGDPADVTYTDLDEAKAAATILAAHDPSKNVQWTEHAADPATCDRPGTYKYYTCACHEGKMFKNNTKDAGEYTSATVVDPQKSHVFAPVAGAGRTKNCAEFGYQLYNCTQPGCDAQYITNYVYAKGAHTPGEYEDAGAATPDKAPTCTKTGKDYYWCTTCKGEYYNDVEATGHHNKDKEELKETDCPKEGADRICVACRDDGDDATPAQIPANHDKYRETEAGATCVDPAMTLQFCPTCGLNEAVVDTSVNEGKPLGHNFIIPEKDPTATENGEYKCERCDETDSFAGIKFKFEAANGTANLAADAAFADGHVVTLTLYATALSDAAIKVGAISFEIVNTAGVEFIGAEQVAGSGFMIGMGSYVSGQTTKVGASLLADPSNQATIPNNGEYVAIMTLTYKISSATIDDATFSVASADVDVENVAKDDFYVAAESSTAVSKKINISTLMDVDGGGVTISDALAAYALVGNEDKYNSVADVNRDGTVDAKDLRLIMQFVNAGADTDSDIYKVIVGRKTAA